MVGPDIAVVAGMVVLIFACEEEAGSKDGASNGRAGKVAVVAVANRDAPVRNIAIDDRARKGWAAKCERRQAARDDAAHVVLRGPFERTDRDLA